MAKVDVSQWAVAIFPKNKQKSFYGVRLFKTPDHAMAHYGKSARSSLIFFSPGEMAHRLSPARLAEYLRDITVQFSNEAEQYRSSMIKQEKNLLIEEDSANLLLRSGTREALAKGLWAICHYVGDQVHGLPDSPENEDKFKIVLDKLNSPEGRAVWEKFPKQARVICQALIDLNEPVVEETELHVMVKDLVKLEKLKTKQDPVLIWKYYAPVLGDNGFLFYPGKRHQSENYKEEMNSI